MLRGQHNDPLAATIENRAPEDEDGTGLLGHDRCKGTVVIATSKFNDNQLNTVRGGQSRRARGPGTHEGPF